MLSVLFEVQPDDCELVTDLWECGTAGIVEEDGRLRAFFDDSIDLTGLMLRYRVLEVRRENPPDLTQFSREGWDPILVGDKFLIAPSWMGGETPEGRFRLNIDATTAFGTGRHESTQLMLQVVEQEIRSGQTVLDVGCGSGILSIAALMLGASRVFACDIHDDAVTEMAAHVQIPVFAGSADAVRDHAADVVLVNVSARVIDTLAPDLKRVTKPGGLIILSGFIRDNVPERFTPATTREQGEWVCWTCHPTDVSVSENASSLHPSVHSKQWW